jgi:hypothetical protein
MQLVPLQRARNAGKLQGFTVPGKVKLYKLTHSLKAAGCNP